MNVNEMLDSIFKNTLGKDSIEEITKLFAVIEAIEADSKAKIAALTVQADKYKDKYLGKAIELSKEMGVYSHGLGSDDYMSVSASSNGIHLYWQNSRFIAPWRYLV